MVSGIILYLITASSSSFIIAFFLHLITMSFSYPLSNFYLQIHHLSSLPWSSSHNLSLFFCHYHPLFLQNVHLPTRLLPVTRGLVCLSLVCGYSPDWPRHLLPEKKVTSRISEPSVSVTFGANIHSGSFSNTQLANKDHKPTVALYPLTIWRLQFM
jgi:hypothetical protein